MNEIPGKFKSAAGLECDTKLASSLPDYQPFASNKKSEIYPIRFRLLFNNNAAMLLLKQSQSLGHFESKPKINAYKKRIRYHISNLPSLKYSANTISSENRASSTTLQALPSTIIFPAEQGRTLSTNPIL
jgi:hypothetical protein